MNKFVCGHVYFSLGFVPGNEIDGSYGNFIFIILRNYLTIFQIAAPFYH